MKFLLAVFIVFFFFSCNQTAANNKEISSQNKLIGTWKMVYSEINENDSLKIKDLTNTSFIKIINASHFSFFNQENKSEETFYAGAGTYTINGNEYVETLSYTSVKALRGHTFSFTLEIRGDSLIQSGLEIIEKAGINREIVEKYVRIL